MRIVAAATLVPSFAIDSSRSSAAGCSVKTFLEDGLTSHAQCNDVTLPNLEYLIWIKVTFVAELDRLLFSSRRGRRGLGVSRYARA